MAALVFDRDRAEALLKKYCPAGATTETARGPEFRMNCPFHSDSNPSMSVNLVSGLGHCFGCTTAGNAYARGFGMRDIVAKFESISINDAAKMLKTMGIARVQEHDDTGTKVDKRRKLTHCGIPMQQIDKWNEDLLRDAVKLQELHSATGWTIETIKKFKIGTDGTRFTLPAIHEDIVHNVKFYMPKGSPKYSGVPGHNTNYLWPLANTEAEELWLFEGEKDCILANQEGLTGITFSGGAGVLPKEYIRFFHNKDVRVVYDIDAAGVEGAKNIANVLARVARSVKIIRLPELGMPPNGDFTDYVLKLHGSANHMREMAAMVDSHVVEVGSRIPVPDEIHDTFLEDIIPNKMFFKRVRMHVRAINTLQELTYIVPQEVKLHCERSWGDQCSYCPMYFNEGSFHLLLKPDYQEILQLIDTNAQDQKRVLARIFDLPEKCPKIKADILKNQYMYPIVLIPALERHKTRHTYIQQKAWSFSEPAISNEDYVVEAVVLPHPDTQQMEVICNKIEKDKASIDEFELSDEMKEKLKVFQPCQASTVSATN
jgi:hypothetical protein